MFRFRTDDLLIWTLRGASMLSAAIVLFIIVFLVVESIPVIAHFGPLSFLRDASWHPTSSRFNLVPMLAASLLIAGGAIGLAAPIGIAAAIFSRYYAPAPLAALFRRMIELLAGIPSVVYGFWGLTVLVPIIGRFRPPGPSLLAGIIILFVMILPTVVLLTDAALKGIPIAIQSGAHALGFSRWGQVVRIYLPAARSGISAALLLALVRALGETMAVIMVCGNVFRMPGSIFDPVRTLTANIALEMAYAMGDHRSALFVSGLILTGLVILVVMSAEAIGNADGIKRS